MLCCLCYRPVFRIALGKKMAALNTAAAFDSRHHLELAEAEVAGSCAAPVRPVGAEDIRDLQGGARHARGLSGRLDLQVLQWSFHLAQELGRDLAIAGGVLELLVP